MNKTPDPIECGAILYSRQIQIWISEDKIVLQQINQKIHLFMRGDWGDIDENDKEKNLEVINGKNPSGVLMASYQLNDQRVFWIITNGYGRSSEGFNCCYTTILTPAEY